MRVEIGSPDEFSKLSSKQAVIEKLEEKAGPEARKLRQFPAWISLFAN